MELVRLLVYLVLVAVVGADSSTTDSSTTRSSDLGGCRLQLKDDELLEKIALLKEGGINLIEYNVTLDGTDQLLDGEGVVYESHRWHRVFNRHGEVILSLAFNYDMLSLSLLNIGVGHLDVVLQDNPSGCFASLEQPDAINSVVDILMRDFDEGVEPVYMGNHEGVCYQQLREVKDGIGRFVDECCSRTKSNYNTTCSSIEPPFTIDIMYTLLVILKIGFLLFGPLYLKDWVFSDSPQKKVYSIPMSDELTVTLPSEVVKKYTDKDEVSSKNGVQLECKLKTLHIVVDHAKLITEQKVPVGFFRYIFENIFLCKLMKSQPFQACCAQSIFGSWSKRFLFLPLFSRETSCNWRWKQSLSWGHLFRLVGGVGIFLLISLPFMFRCIMFYVYEKPEIILRKAALDARDLKPEVDHNIFQLLTPAHSALRAVYGLYFVSFIVLAICHKMYPVALRNLIMPALADLQSVSYIEVARMAISHLLLPFEKFGVVGFLVSVLYLPVALIGCLIAVVCYCVPTLYMIGRIFIHHRPSFFKAQTKKNEMDLSRSNETKLKQGKHKAFLSEGTNRCVEDILMLENISHDQLTSPVGKRQKEVYSKRTARERVMLKCPKLIQIFMGIAIIVQMLAILGMYAEVAGFLAEALVLTLMGAIVNASTAHKYVMLVFWMTMYSTSCFNKVYEAYYKVSHKLFSFIKNKLGSQVMTYMIAPEDEHQDMAFKFFTRIEMQNFDQQRRLRSAVVESEDSDVDDVLEEELVWGGGPGTADWKTCSLALFVDKNHVPRIPEKLFFLVSQQEVLGCPGPIYKSMAKATKNLLNMILFLLFVFIIILTFGDIYHLSSTNQLILTAVGGFIPDIIRRVLQPKVDIDVDLNTYTFHQKIQNILCNYKERWPVAELRCLRYTEVDDGNGAGH
ncbi:hypothetical protein CAPTEDRAFT_223912 [Capitella teleta]|uniref:Uncharacterized protein n=1 Tax=Capitella teleta TaxID=283909 RepID=R7VJ32_CAPTE|nr:hypothetical protein CAPTEDRAFT_223912 [Capitella teleta]|eukprot:ELU15720.1 hypothetical protein CAPTEDRAFT_223912 [Capitella teleta]